MQSIVSVVTAVRHIERMRGGAQSHLVHCSDGRNYVVKFRNNPQGVRILANEFIFSNIARLLGLSVPNYKIVAVDDSLIRNSSEFTIWLPPDNLIPCEAGLHFGSEYVISPLKGNIVNESQADAPSRIRNREEFMGMLVLDKWAFNRDSRQVVFWKRCRDKKYSASFIDHGYCFGANDWEFLDRWGNGVFWGKNAYFEVEGWGSFEPWLSQLESLKPDLIWKAVGDTPPIWYQSDWFALERLAETLIIRRHLVRNLIEQFRTSPRNPFPNWNSRYPQVP